MTQRLILTRGLPASGKSTYAESYLANPNTVRLERDMLRDQLYGEMGRIYVNTPDSGATDEEFKKFLSDRERTVSEVQKSMADAAVKTGKSVIISDTNLRAAYVREWAKFAAARGLEFNVINFDNVPLDILITRDKLRNNSVGEAIIRDMWAKFTKNGKLKDVDVSKELSESLIVEPYDNPTDLPSAIIVDIDGTLAEMQGRSPYEWHRVGEDSPVEAVIKAVHAASLFGYWVIVMSGRDGSCRAVTEQWLDKHLGSSWNELFMRAEGDNRKDDLVKYELFNNNVRDRYHVGYVLDDRNQVIKMWRALGLNCFQVAEGDF